MKAALFLDRDGVMNEDTAYAHGSHPITLVPGIVDIFFLLNHNPVFFPVVVSNQSGIARGIYTEEDFQRYTQRLYKIIQAKSGYKMDNVPAYFSPSYDKKSFDLKPNPGMLLSAARKYDIQLRESYMIGDGFSDVEAGYRAGCRGFFHRSCGMNVFDLFRCIPEIKYLLETSGNIIQEKVLH